MESIKPKKGQTLNLKIESLAFGGMGVARIDGHVIFVKNSLPGQEVSVMVIKRKKNYLEARVTAIINESPFSVPIRCDHFKYCGGCTFQNLDYSQQLIQKQSQVADVMRRLGRFENAEIATIVGCDRKFHYRNKMEYTFSNRRFITELDEDLPRDFVLGQHTPGKFDKILNIDECHLQESECSAILQTVKKTAYENNIEPYDILKHTGFLRYMIIRNSFSSGEIMVNLVTSFEEPVLLDPIVDILMEKFPLVTSIINNINSRKGGTSQGEKEIVLFGKPFITESIGRFKFEISANSFFQTNPIQAEKLYEMIREDCELTGSETVYDLYCGTGTIGIFLAESAKEVIGIELVKSAVMNARENARLNDITNIQFFEGDLMTYFNNQDDINTLSNPDVLVIDPPRSGMHPRTVTDVMDMAPDRIVYVSCNPSTQARDLQLLCAEKYKLLRCRPVDMFPHTPHIENISVLVKS
jgi:23S rRNA (uracil1939-C5)-methyltransferase